MTAPADARRHDRAFAEMVVLGQEGTEHDAGFVYNFTAKPRHPAMSPGSAKITRLCSDLCIR